MRRSMELTRKESIWYAIRHGREYLFFFIEIRKTAKYAGPPLSEVLEFASAYLDNVGVQSR